MEEMVRPKRYQSYFSRIIRNFRFFSKAVPSGVKVSFSKVLAIAIPFHLYISQLMDFRWDSIHWYHLYWRRLSTWDYLCLGTRTLGRCPKSWGTISHWAWMNLCFKNLTKKLAMLLGEQQLELQPQLQHCMISTQETMNWAGWARDSTFCHFYFRPPEHLGEQFWDQNQLKLQTCEGHVDEAESSKVQWLSLVAAECYSQLYEEDEGEYQHVLPTLHTPDRMALFILCWSASDIILFSASAYLFLGAKCNISGNWNTCDTLAIWKTEE